MNVDRAIADAYLSSVIGRVKGDTVGHVDH